jgi:hypothetical protein
MRLKRSERTRLRERVMGHYARALLAGAPTIVNYLAGQLFVITRHLPEAVRFNIAEQIRDCADAIEREGNG